ncbi:tyrosine 3-monooxygenase-like [Artemia franciscana]|uniref:tyrosine 3-monooxygenase-like n=1 Tax=Artemia franciscana TaxID=6661 RepID=UPI0032DA2A49
MLDKGSNGSIGDDCIKAAVVKSYSVENGYRGRRRSLVDDARFESKINTECRKSIIEEVKALFSPSEEPIMEDDLLLNNNITNLISQPNQRLCMIFKSKENLGSLYKILKTIESCKGTILHVESRKSQWNDADSCDILFKMDIPREGLFSLLSTFKQDNNIFDVQVIRDPTNVKDCWYPKHISDLDRCNHLISKYEPDLDQGHPGFSDKQYRKRRQMVANIAFTYTHGDPIPRIEYTEDEKRTWKAVFDKVEDLLESHVCKQFRDVLETLKKEVGFCSEKIPQLEDLSNFLKRRTGFSLRPAAGLLSARDFLASLAFRVFQCTQYIRHHNAPHHSPEPDAVHELLGHVPMLADPQFAQFSQELGIASIGASDADIEKIATLYWFTVEFGLCKENGKLKAYGAGLISSYGELLHALSDKPEYKPFEPSACAVQAYQDQDFQDIYFVAETLEDCQFKFRRWVEENIRRPYDLWYNPFTQTLEVLDSTEKVHQVTKQINWDLNTIQFALKRLGTL